MRIRPPKALPRICVMPVHGWLALLLLLLPVSSFAQEIQNGFSYREIGSNRYFRVNYNNDLFFNIDYYYSQGAHFELVSPGIARLPTRFILLHPSGCRTRYGLSLESAGYTPTSIVSDSLLVGDRPYSGMGYLKAFSIAVNEARQERYISTFTAGFMGPAALGYEIQSGIHKRTGSPEPKGWQYQIGNSLILTYELNYERVFYTHRNILLTATGMIRTGTYTTKATVGSILMAGQFNNPFRSEDKHAKLQVYCFADPRLDLVAYDATLQGGLFTNNSAYTIPSNNISRLVFRCDAGLRLGYHGIWASAYGRYLTKEFSTGIDHSIAGFEVAFAF
jgi:lipid A 3-O-deacylase